MSVYSGLVAQNSAMLNCWSGDVC